MQKHYAPRKAAAAPRKIPERLPAEIPDFLADIIAAARDEARAVEAGETETPENNRKGVTEWIPGVAPGGG